MTEREQQALLSICLMAAFADGANDERERAQIKRVADTLAPDSSFDLQALYQDVLLKRRSLEQAAAYLTSSEAKQLAYEMAVCTCDADGAQSDAEKAFLQQLATLLGIAPAAHAVARDADALADAPLASGGVLVPAAPAATADNAARDAELDKMILNYSILNGALELLPQSLASMAILPLQMKMVYRVGKTYGFELDRGHIKDLIATLGIGLAGQYIEQIGRKLLGGLLSSVGGGMLGGVGSAATGSAFSFATTYALGQVAKQYYAAGRNIDMAQLKQVFGSLLEQGKSLQSRYTSEIQSKARTIDMQQIASLVRGR